MSCSESNGVIVLICGLPASGKTKFTNDTCQHIHNSAADLKHVFDIKETNLYPISFDDYLTTITTNDEEWKESRQNFTGALEHFIANVLDVSKSTIENEASVYYEKILAKFPEHPINNKCTFILDDNFYYVSMRHEWYKIAHKLGFGQVFLQCPFSLALTQNAKRTNDRVPENVIVRMGNRAEWPDPNTDKIHCHSLIIQSEDSFENKVSLAMNLIQKALNDPVLPLCDKREEKEASKMESSKNLIHQSDIILRKLVSDIFKKRNNSKTFAGEISNVKLSILTKIKTRELRDLEGLDLNLDKLRERLEEQFWEEISACKIDLR